MNLTVQVQIIYALCIYYNKLFFYSLLIEQTELQDWLKSNAKVERLESLEQENKKQAAYISLSTAVLLFSAGCRRSHWATR